MPTRITSPRTDPAARRRASRSSGAGDLQVRRLARHDHDRAPRRLDQRGVVGAVGAAGVRGAQRRGAERLRGLHRDQLVARHGLDDALAVDALDRVGDREPGTAPSAPSRTAAITAREERVAGERAGRVVHHDDLGVARHRGEPGAHRVGAGRAAGDRGGDRRAVPARRRPAARRPRRHSAACAVAPRGRRADRRRAANCFGPAEARAGAGGHDDRPGLHRSILARVVGALGRRSGVRRRRRVGRVVESAAGGRAKTIRPALVGTIDETTSETGPAPTRSSPPFTTTIEPSSRKPTPWPG